MIDHNTLDKPNHDRSDVEMDDLPGTQRPTSLESQRSDRPAPTAVSDANSSDATPSSPNSIVSQEHDAGTTLLLGQDQHHNSSDPSCIGEGTQGAKVPVSAVVVPTTKLHRSGYILFLVCVYAAVAITAWVLTCLLTVKPLTTDSYSVDTRNQQYGDYQPAWFREFYVKSARLYRLARTLQAIVTVLTIPLTSAVCSAATVVYLQASKNGQKHTIRQMLTLADKAWTDAETIFKIIGGGGRRYGSLLFFFALFLTILGATIAPMQALFVSQKPIKVPIFPMRIRPIVDIPDKFDSHATDWHDNNLVTVRTRYALTTTTSSQPQPRLWHDNYNCSALSTDQHPKQCGYGAVNLGTMPMLSGSFLAQLPFGYHTGLIRQFIPRFNSSVTWEQISPGDMPKDCGNNLTHPYSLFHRYANSTLGHPETLGAGASSFTNIDSLPRNWSLEACMPSDQSRSPWRSTRDRQDFTEVLYLNVSVMGSYRQVSTPDSTAIFKITSNTTGGYFELPNYMNGGVAGPLLASDPAKQCGFDCCCQTCDKTPSLQNNPTSQDAELPDLSFVRNKGPLLTVAMALFGRNSFIPSRMEHQDSFIHNYTGEPDGREPAYAQNCAQLPPLLPLFSDSSQPGSWIKVPGTFPCIPDNLENQIELDRQISLWLGSFFDRPDRLQNAFASAIILATEQWLTSWPGGDGSGSESLLVFYDEGEDLLIPAVSLAGMVLVSTLLTVYLSCLLALAIYSARTPRWTKLLDAFAMMRIGASIYEEVPLRVASDVTAVGVLNKKRGFIGGCSDGANGVRSLGLGAEEPLTSDSCYACYPEEDKKKAKKRSK